MFDNKAILVIGLFSIIAIFSFAPNSDATLWELVIELSVENDIISSGESIVITGRVVDHAYDPISNAEVLVRTGAHTNRTFTDSDGIFKAEFENFQKIPGTYNVNVIATLDGMTGLSGTQFELKGDPSPVLGLQAKLSTDQARKYLSANKDDFEKDPLGQTLFKYYHGLLQELILENKQSSKLTEEEINLEKQRIIADTLREQAIKEHNPGNGIYEGYLYDRYVENLDPEIRDLVVSQLNFTKSMFEEAQKTRDEILANGGTYEEARQAYLDMITISKETLGQFNQERLQNQNNGTQSVKEDSNTKTQPTEEDPNTETQPTEEDSNTKTQPTEEDPNDQ